MQGLSFVATQEARQLWSVEWSGCSRRYGQYSHRRWHSWVHSYILLTWGASVWASLLSLGSSKLSDLSSETDMVAVLAVLLLYPSLCLTDRRTDLTDYCPAGLQLVFGNSNLGKVWQIKLAQLAFRCTMNIILLTYLPTHHWASSLLLEHLNFFTVIRYVSSGQVHSVWWKIQQMRRLSKVHASRPLFFQHSSQSSASVPVHLRQTTARSWTTVVSAAVMVYHGSQEHGSQSVMVVSSNHLLEVVPQTESLNSVQSGTALTQTPKRESTGGRCYSSYLYDSVFPKSTRCISPQ